MLFFTKSSFSLWMLVVVATTKSVHSTSFAALDGIEDLGMTISSIRQNMSGAKVANPFLSWKGSGVSKSGEEDWLLVDVTSKSFELASDLSNAEGAFQITGCLPTGHACSGWLKMTSASSALERVEQNPAITISPAMPTTNQYKGKGDHQGAVVPLQIANIRKAFPKLTGKGLKIGVLSDSFNAKGGYDLDIETGDLPDDIKILKEGPESSSDEGRAMMQLIHDIAPDAKLVFRTAFLGEIDFAIGIQELVDEGCDVIVDDIAYLTEPIYQEGVIAQYASDAVVLGEVAYFSSIGNGQGSGWTDEYKPTSCEFSGTQAVCHDFGEGNYKMRIKSTTGATVGLFWDAPFPVYVGDIEPSDFLGVFVWDAEGTPVYVAQPNPGVAVIPLGAPPGEYDLAFFVYAGNAPTTFKFIDFFSNLETELPSNASFTVAHATAPSVAGVAAADEMQRALELEVENFSSTVTDPLIFDRQGNRLDNPKVPKQPRFTGPDGSENSFFGTPSTSNSTYKFYGTSASAPNVAALALLLLQENSELAPEKVYKILESTAIDMQGPGFDFTTGGGFVDGLQAVVEAKKLKLKGKKYKKNKKKKSVLKELKDLEKKKVCYDYTKTSYD